MDGNQGNCWDLENIYDYVNITNSLTIDYVTTLTSYNLLKKYSSLTSLSIYYTNISDLSFLEGMTLLTSLTLNDNQISNLKSLENLKNLKTLNLINNTIYDYSTYTDSEENTIKYKNLDIIVNLKNTYKKLTTVKLSGNKGITDWSPVSLIDGWDSSNYSGW